VREITSEIFEELEGSLSYEISRQVYNRTFLFFPGIRTSLLDSDEQECPACHEKEISPDTLIPSRYLRNSVANFGNQTGYLKPGRPPTAQQAAPPPAPAPAPAPTPASAPAPAPAPAPAAQPEVPQHSAKAATPPPALAPPADDLPPGESLPHSQSKSDKSYIKIKLRARL